VAFEPRVLQQTTGDTMQVSNLTNSPVFAIAFHKRYGVGIAVVITANTTEQVPAPDNMLIPYIESVRLSFQEHIDGTREERCLPTTDRPDEEITIFFSPTPKDLLPDWLKRNVEINIKCPYCSSVRSVDQLIVFRSVAPELESILDKPIICWSCQDNLKM
jgi:hypothetical protein